MYILNDGKMDPEIHLFIFSSTVPPYYATSVVPEIFKGVHIASSPVDGGLLYSANKRKFTLGRGYSRPPKNKETKN